MSGEVPDEDDDEHEPIDFETELGGALAALASDDDEAALQRLVAAWSACRSPAIVPLVDTLASRIEPRQKAIAGKTANDRYEAFVAVASDTRQADLARLVTLLPKLAYGDLSTALDTLLYHWPYTPRMEALLATTRLPGYGDRVEELRKVHAAARDEGPLSDRARAAISELERVLATADDAGVALLAQVHADPEADAPRLVYADWATSRGDPHGELIALQFARRDRAPDAAAVRREKELLELYMQRWLGPIWSAIRPYSVRFERGFLASVTVEPFAVIAPLPEWSTVYALELAYHEALPMEAFPALRELRNVTTRLLAPLATEPRELTHLGFSSEPVATAGSFTTREPAHIIERIADGRAFPALESLGMWGDPENWSWLWTTPIADRLRRIEVAHSFAGESPWVTATLPPQIREIRIRERANEARFVREACTLDVICREPSRDRLAWAHMLELVPRGVLTAARFVVPRRMKQETIDRLEQMTRRYHPAIERFTVDVDPFV